jgi:hypothetical protein
MTLCVGRDESTGIGVFHRLHVEVEGDDFPIIVVLLGHWSSKELIKL